jgi:lipid-A-disaccharide synthase
MRSLKFDGPVFMNVCEPSGDLYASYLIRAIKAKNPNLKIFAIGSKNVAQSGANILMDYNKMMTLGFTGGIFSSLRNYSIYRKIGRMMYKIRPKTFIGVAYPGMNLLLSKYAKNLGCRVYYFLPPQIWAWGTFRKYFIKQWIDTVISVFPLEFEFYRKTGINTVLMENPLFRALDKYKRGNFDKRVGFMPGSRKSEIKRNLPVIIELAKRISQKTNDIEFSLILHPDSILSSRDVVTRDISKSVPGMMITMKNRYQVMKDCDLLIICSGTASLEAAVMKIPQVFFNRPAFFDYHLVRRFLKISEYNLTNLYFRNNIVPSFVSADAAYLIEKIQGFLYKTFLIDG